MEKMILLTTFILMAQTGWTQNLSCQSVLQSVVAEKNDSSNFKEHVILERLSREGKSVFTTPDGERRMVYRHHRPVVAGQPTMVYVHGLGDSMKNMEPLWEKALNEGKGVLMIDQYGHGDTLDLTISRSKKKDPLKQYDYMNNSRDLHDLIIHLGIENLYLVGHSLGGNVVFYTAAEFAKQKESSRVKLRGLVTMAPYAGRADTYARDYIRSPEFWIEETSKVLAAAPGGQSIDTLVDPYYRFFWILRQYPKFMQDIYNNLLGVQNVKDAIQDPVMDELLRARYREYFENKMKSEKGTDKLSKQDLADIQIKAEVCLGITKVNRSIDLLDSLKSLPDIDVPILILGGRYDKLVLTSQLKDLLYRFEREGFNAELIFMNGPNADHFFPQRMAEEVYKTIEVYFEKRALNNAKKNDKKKLK